MDEARARGYTAFTQCAAQFDALRPAFRGSEC